MELLVLGGTHFLGRAVVAEGIARGHHVTTLTRGESGPPQEGATAVYADRTDPDQFANALAGVPVDGVVDTSGRSVAAARHAAAVLSDVSGYAYVSSLNAYRNWPPGPISGEDDPVWSDADDLDDYGPMKAASERILGDAFGDRLLVARAGLILGAHDNVGRLPWWLWRTAQGGRMVVPDALDQPMAFVDVRDLAGWLVDCVDRRTSGPVNATGPLGMVTFGSLLDASREAVAATGGTPAEPVVVSEERLTAAGVTPWVQLPFWLPREIARTAWDVNTTTARALGLPSRPVKETVEATWDWVRHSPDALKLPESGGPGMPVDLERELLA